MFIDYSDEIVKEYSYKSLIKFAKHLKTKIGKRNVILLLAGNNIASLFAYVSCLLTKNVVIFISGDDIQSPLINKVLKMYHPNYIWCKDTFKEVFAHHEILINAFGYVLLSKRKSINVMNEELALLIPTSGSTGISKMVKLSYQNLYSNTRDICQYLGVMKEDVAITILPIYYVYGLSIINTHIWKRAKIVITKDSVISEKFWYIVAHEKVTSLSGVPFTYEMFLRCGIEKRDLRSIRYFTQAGGMLNIEIQKYVAKFCKENEIDFYVMYGQSEATARMSYILITKHEEKIGSVGKAIPNGKISICDEEGRRIEEKYKEGEIVYEGENVFMGYAMDDSDLAEEDKIHGILHTGDMGYLDEDNDLYITGRKSRFIKIYGKRVSLDEIQMSIENHMLIKKCVCIQKNDQLYIFISQNGSEKGKIVSFLWEKYRIWKERLSFIFVEEFPYNEYGKIQYSKLERRLEL